MEFSSLTPFTVRRDDGLVPNEIAQGGWGPTLGGQVIGGLLARGIEQHVVDEELVPARLTVDILRRVATAPVRVCAEVVRIGRRMQSVDATMTQDGEVVARASALYLRRSTQPDGQIWTTPLTMPPLPEEPAHFSDELPMFIRAYGTDGNGGDGFQWQVDGPRYAWIREVRALVEGEQMSPFIRAAMAVDVTSSMTNFSTTGLAFINADYTLTLSRLPEGPYIGLAALTHYSDDGVATGTASLFDTRGPIGSGMSTAVANLHFLQGKFADRPR
ncbi:thioesterase family protein [Mycolicibacterium mengxianglii]|uniref:thioesterase family protein n=1 Tax=Mycolicibacterium mengxianglii TaxID=2736649 RepID=UPI0018EEE4DF|nr:thioesterase family protein [Mycolicibacterium mengxianglii]